ncbi:MAG: SDR family NAD(P)-dependent oxidoreductase [candidate division NC10 bacterium]|nr:SDR family NAD(P)-dependent oxidoreductase [candidate division NC10 bacterium]MDE2320701.1 SDR family NAD(P)-dependent oxidoreductase [candidate division NC10 bacterium]
MTNVAFYPHFAKKRGGTEGFQGGKYGFPSLAVYCAPKFGLNGFTEALAREMAGDGIRVYAVCPVRERLTDSCHRYPDIESWRA